MRKTFDRLTIERVLRADSDGMPVFRTCFEHETLLSFWDDEGNYKFIEWWGKEGSKLFNEFYNKEAPPLPIPMPL